MKMNKILTIVASAVILAGCSEYQKVLKSTDRDYRYLKAKEYYQKGDFVKATSLLDDMVPYFKGTDKAEEALYIQAECYFGQKDYEMSAHYFRQLAKMYPGSSYVEDCYYMEALSYYKSSPKPRLDQANTQQAIDAFLTYIELYPETSKAKEVEGYIQDLQDKLAYKSYLNAKLYFDLGNYLGNNYKAAVIEAQNSLKKYPGSKHAEDLSFLILKSKYIQAINSIEEKVAERFRDTIDEYYSFKNDFPNSKYLSDAEKMFRESEKVIKSFESKK